MNIITGLSALKTKKSQLRFRVLYTYLQSYKMYIHPHPVSNIPLVEILY